MTNNNTTTTAGTTWVPAPGTTWVLYWTAYARDGSEVSQFSNQDICSALGVSVPNALDPDGDELQEFFLADRENAEWDNCESAYLIHKVATTVLDEEPVREFMNRNDLLWYLSGVQDAADFTQGGDIDIYAHACLELNNQKFADFEADLQSAFNDFVNDLCENDELAV